MELHRWKNCINKVKQTFQCGVGLVPRPALDDHGRVHVAPADVDAVPQDGGGRRGGLAAADALVKVDQLPTVVQDVVGIFALQQSISVESNVI